MGDATTGDVYAPVTDLWQQYGLLLDPDDEPEDSVLPGMSVERRPLGDSYFYAPNEARARAVLDRIYGEAWRRHPVRRCCWPECSSNEC